VKFGRFPHYYLVTFLLKTPLPLLILLVLAAVWGPRLPGRTAAFLWLPVAAYAALALAWGPQIGHRHLLPLYPFLFVSAGRTVVSPRAPRRILTGLLASWYAFGTLAVHPHYLAYFNELAGGQGRAWKLLVDSNLDWGQDLPALKEWMDEHGVARIKFSYFGGADPAYYGVRCDFLPSYEVPPATPIVREVHPGDLVAVSVTTLQGLFLSPEDGTLMARLRGLEPVGRAGWSIRIYRADFHWRPPD